MPEPHQDNASAQPHALVALAPMDDDYALGFECADPALQIERWGEDEPRDLQG